MIKQFMKQDLMEIGSKSRFRVLSLEHRMKKCYFRRINTINGSVSSSIASTGNFAGGGIDLTSKYSCQTVLSYQKPEAVS